jgi:hypothetical protein
VVKAAASRLQWNAETGWLAENVKVADALGVGPLGPVSTVVSGGIVSTVQ